MAGGDELEFLHALAPGRRSCKGQHLGCVGLFPALLQEMGQGLGTAIKDGGLMPLFPGKPLSINTTSMFLACAASIAS